MHSNRSRPHRLGQQLRFDLAAAGQRSVNFFRQGSATANNSAFVD